MPLVVASGCRHCSDTALPETADGVGIAAPLDTGSDGPLSDYTNDAALEDAAEGARDGSRRDAPPTDGYVDDTETDPDASADLFGGQADAGVPSIGGLCLTCPPGRVCIAGRCEDDPRRTLAVGERHTCMVENGAVFCFGWNDYGQLGDGTRTSRSSPVRAGVLDDVVDIDVGWAHSCALRANGALSCWGRNEEMQLGLWEDGDRLEPTRSNRVHQAVSVATGSVHTCVLSTRGTASCWGHNGLGQLAAGVMPGPSRVPVLITPEPVAVDVESPIVRLRSGPAVNCGLIRFPLIGSWPACAGLIHECFEVGTCGGFIHSGMSSGGWATGPAPDPGSRTYVSVAARTRHGCAATTDGFVVCRGANDRGQLGDGTREPKLFSRGTGVLLGEPTEDVSVGEDYSCARTRNGDVYCWGSNDLGILPGTLVDSTLPVQVPVGGFARELDSERHTCVRRRDGSVVCWGPNDDGQLGIGTTGSQTWPLSPVKFPERAD